MSAIDTHIELSASEQRQRLIWASGDYNMIAARIAPTHGQRFLHTLAQ